jgi:hypothetical protein
MEKEKRKETKRSYHVNYRSKVGDSFFRIGPLSEREPVYGQEVYTND